ncbi:MAG TPA: rod shape-determining protein MreC [bacterium]|nr:rod shape-determining protein MreC [bacterium]HPW39724.1 rod shape-determining protein MreC [bacterium]
MKRIIKLATIALVLILFLSALHYLGWLNPIESLLVRVFSPAQATLYSASQGAGSFYDSWVRRRDLLAENNQLRDWLEQYQTDHSKIISLEQENQLLKQELNFIEEQQLKAVSAKIITGVSDPLSRSVVINRGSVDGLVKGLAVVSDRGILVGKIHEVNDYFSKVLLLTDNNSKVAATIQNTDQTAGLVEGQFGLSFSMTNIPQDQQIKNGDLVVTSGLEGNIPKNLLIARIESVNQVENEIFKTAVLSPVISFDNLSYVLVLTP